MATIDTVKKALTLLSKTRPGTDLSTVSVEAYQAVLSPIPDRVLERVSILAARQPGAFLPSAGDLYDAALNLLDDQPNVDDAWVLVWEKARGYSVELPARTAAALKAIGGIPQGGWEMGDVPFRRQEFVKIYEAEQRRWKQQAAMPGTKLLESGK